mmetsp:Transcript_6503/g.11207  ORF Transcript_6503/g.11207 Transcript_6503/m.11207 type:complete len:237 (-) Transcript_6503:80-790(-)
MALVLRQMNSVVVNGNNPMNKLTMSAPECELEDMMSSTSTCFQQPQKSVSFAPQVKVFPIRHINDFTPYEVETIWYRERELKDIKADCLTTARLVFEQRPLDEDTQCFRGLEYRTPDGHKKRVANKHSALDAVLDEQERQWDSDQDDAQDIADVYSEISRPCATAAHHAGLEDEAQAMLVYHETFLLTRSSKTTSSFLSSRPLVKQPLSFARSPARINTQDGAFIVDRWGVGGRAA